MVTKDKVTLEKEVQLLNKDKRNLEVKIRSLEQHIRVLQETHARETGIHVFVIIVFSYTGKINFEKPYEQLFTSTDHFVFMVSFCGRVKSVVDAFFRSSVNNLLSA